MSGSSKGPQALHALLLAVLLPTSGCGLLVKMCASASVGSIDSEMADVLEGDDPGECTDRIDNNRDGKTDCADFYCAVQPMCDARMIAAKDNEKRVAKAKERLGGTYSASCDRKGFTTLTVNDGGSCTFLKSDCTKGVSVDCAYTDLNSVLEVRLQEKGRDVPDVLQLRIQDAYTLIVEANQYEICGCGRTPRLVFKKPRG